MHLRELKERAFSRYYEPAALRGAILLFAALLGNRTWLKGLQREAERLGLLAQRVLPVQPLLVGITEARGVEGPKVFDHRPDHAGEFVRGGGDRARGARSSARNCRPQSSNPDSVR